ncbi:MAG: hypothetical protein ACTHMU_03665 [Thermomicrobiales bacterium]
MEALHPSCLLCGRQYNRQSRPQWALDAAGAVAGTVHTTCAAHHPARRRYASYPAMLAHAAQAAWRSADTALLRQTLAPLMEEVRARRFIILAERAQRLI